MTSDPPSSITSLKELALEALNLNDFENASRLIQEALTLFPEDANLLVDIGNMYTSLDKTDDAETYYTEAIAVDSQCVRALYNLAALCANKGENAKAIELFEKAVVVQPESEMIHYSLGRLHYLNGDYASAKKRYEAYLEINPESPRSNFGLGTIAFKEQNFDHAMQLFEKVLPHLQQNESGIDSNLFSTYYYLGYIFRWKDNKEKSIEAFSKYLDYNDADADVYRSLAYLVLEHSEAGDIESAKKAGCYFMKALDLAECTGDVENDNFLPLLAEKIPEETEYLDYIVEGLKALLNRYPDKLFLAGNSVSMYGMSGRDKEGIAICDFFLQRFPENVELKRLKSVLIEMDKPDA